MARTKQTVRGGAAAAAKKKTATKTNKVKKEPTTTATRKKNPVGRPRSETNGHFTRSAGKSLSGLSEDDNSSAGSTCGGLNSYENDDEEVQCLGTRQVPVAESSKNKKVKVKMEKMGKEEKLLREGTLTQLDWFEDISPQPFPVDSFTFVSELHCIFLVAKELCNSIPNFLVTIPAWHQEHPCYT